MKNSKNVLLSLLLALVMVGLNISCSDDGEENKPYVGKWESRVYPVQNPLTGEITGYQKMVFEFTNTDFTDQVYLGASADAITWVIGMMGDIENSSEGVLDVTVTGVAALRDAYTMFETEPETFAAIWGAPGSLGAMLFEDFTAEYEFKGDTLALSLPTKLSTAPTVLNLTKAK